MKVFMSLRRHESLSCVGIGLVWGALIAANIPRPWGFVLAAVCGLLMTMAYAIKAFFGSDA